MLVVTRKQGEAVAIIDNATGVCLATVKVVSVRGAQVRVGLDGLADIKFLRDELTQEGLRPGGTHRDR